MIALCAAAARADLIDLQQAFLQKQYGMFICYGMQTYQASIPAPPNLPVDTFSPPGAVNTDAWATVAKDAGMKYGIFTVKHHEGFALWDTNQSAYDISATNWYANEVAAGRSGDLVRQYTDSFRARGLGITLYYSMWDATNGIVRTGGKSSAEAIAYVENELHQLLTNYGPVDVLWFDGWKWKLGYDYLPYSTIYNYIKSISPNTLVLENNHEYDLSHTDIVGYECGTYDESSHFPANNTMPSELYRTVRADGQWYYHAAQDPNNLHPASTLANQYLYYTARNANYVLDVTPDTAGTIPSQQVNLLYQVKSLIDGIGPTMPTWDASSSGGANPVDGSGNWTSTSTSWSLGSGNIAWSSGGQAVFGMGTGSSCPYTVTISGFTPTASAATGLSALTFANHNYTIAGTGLTYNATAYGTLVEIKNGTSATIAVPITFSYTSGTSITGDVIGSGTLTLTGGMTMWPTGGGQPTTGGFRVGAGTGSNVVVNLNGGTYTGGGSNYKAISVAPDAGSAGTLNVMGSSVINLTGTDWELTISNGGTAAVNVQDSANIHVSLLTVGGNVNGAGSGTLSLNGGTTTGDVVNFGRSAGTNASSGTINLNVGGTLVAGRIAEVGSNVTSTFNFNGGTLRPTGSNSSDFFNNTLNNVYVKNGGAVIDTSGYNVTIAQPLKQGTDSTGGLTKQGSGTLTLSGANTYTGPTSIAGGTLKLGSSGTIADSAAIDLSGGTLDLTAKTSGFSLAGSQTLQGNGTVQMASGQTLAAPAGVAPGHSPGTLTVAGSLTLGGTSTFEVNGWTGGLYDLVQGTVATGERVTFGGTLNIDIDTGFGGSAKLFDFDLYSGTFSAVNLSGVVGGRTISFNAATGVLTVTGDLLAGDANGDGFVNLADLGILIDHYGTASGATWANGDFNGDSSVNLADLGSLIDTYGGGTGLDAQGQALLAAHGLGGTAVPEPSTIVLLLVGSAAASLWAYCVGREGKE